MSAFVLDLPTNPAEISTVDALARSRRFLLMRAHQLLALDGREPSTGDAQSLSALAGVLMSSLEELKVAEEELRLAEQRIEALCGDGEKLTRHYRDLFMHLPMPTIVTDIYASILESNAAAADMLKRDAPSLEGRAFVTLLDPSYRTEFRRQLLRVIEVDTVTRWRVVLHRKGDLPVTVAASVKRVASIGSNGSGALLWLFEPPTLND